MQSYHLLGWILGQRLLSPSRLILSGWRKKHQNPQVFSFDWGCFCFFLRTFYKWTKFHYVFEQIFLIHIRMVCGKRTKNTYPWHYANEFLWRSHYIKPIMVIEFEIQVPLLCTFAFLFRWLTFFFIFTSFSKIQGTMYYCWVYLISCFEVWEDR